MSAGGLRFSLSEVSAGGLPYASRDLIIESLRGLGP